MLLMMSIDRCTDRTLTLALLNAETFRLREQTVRDMNMTLTGTWPTGSTHSVNSLLVWLSIGRRSLASVLSPSCARPVADG